MHIAIIIDKEKIWNALGHTKENGTHPCLDTNLKISYYLNVSPEGKPSVSYGASELSTFQS